MTSKVRDYYQKANISEALMARKEKLFEKNPDIEQEFEYWIENGQYKAREECLVIEGYTAEKIASLSKLIDGEGAFVMLAELRDNPEKAMRRIKAGFSIK